MFLFALGVQLRVLHLGIKGISCDHVRHHERLQGVRSRNMWWSHQGYIKLYIQEKKWVKNLQESLVLGKDRDTDLVQVWTTFRLYIPLWWTPWALADVWVSSCTGWRVERMSICFEITRATYKKEVKHLVSRVCSHGVVWTSLSVEEALSVLLFLAPPQHAAHRLISVSSHEMNWKIWILMGEGPYSLSYLK